MGGQSRVLCLIKNLLKVTNSAHNELKFEVLYMVEIPFNRF